MFLKPTLVGFQAKSLKNLIASPSFTHLIAGKKHAQFTVKFGMTKNHLSAVLSFCHFS